MDAGGGDVVRRLGGVEVGLRGEAAGVQVPAPVQRALRVVPLHLSGLEVGFDRGDFLGAAAIKDVGEIGLGLRQRRLGVSDGDFRVGRFERRDPVAGLQLVAAPHIFVGDPGDLDRRDVDIFALDVADGGVRGRGASGQDLGDERDGADRVEDHGFVFRAKSSAASRAAARLARTTRLMAEASGRSDVAPVHAPQNRGAGEAEVDDLPDQREDGEPGPLAFGRRAGRARPDEAGLDVYRPDAGVHPLEGGGRLEHLAHHEGDDPPRRVASDNAVDHGAEETREQIAGGVGRQGFDALGLAERVREDLAYGRNDEVGAGEPQPLLAAEMIGDGCDVRLRRAGDLAGRGGLVALGAEEVERSADKRRPRGFGAGRRQRFAGTGWHAGFLHPIQNKSID